MTKPYSFLFYFLTIIFFFFLGLAYAGYIEAGKGQMLAGGAIVLGYGVMGAGIGLVLSLFCTYYFNRNIIVKSNIVLAILIAAFWAYFAYKFKQRDNKNNPPKIEEPKKPTTTQPANRNI